MDVSEQEAAKRPEVDEVCQRLQSRAKEYQLDAVLLGVIAMERDYRAISMVSQKRAERKKLERPVNAPTIIVISHDTKEAR